MSIYACSQCIAIHAFTEELPPGWCKLESGKHLCSSCRKVEAFGKIKAVLDDPEVEPNAHLMAIQTIIEGAE